MITPQNQTPTRLRSLARIFAALLVLTLGGCLSEARSLADGKPLIDFSTPGVESRIGLNSQQGSAYKIVEGQSGKILQVTCSPVPSENLGVSIKPERAIWDLSKYGEVDADVTNTSAEPLSIFLRVDNGGDWHTSPFDMEQTQIAPGKTGTVKVVFGYSWGNTGYALDPSKVVQLLLLSNTPKSPATFDVTSITAAGAPGEKPGGSIEKIKPKNGVLVDFSAGSDATQIETREATAKVLGTGSARVAEIAFGPGSPGQPEGAAFKAPARTIWDLSFDTQVGFVLTNPGTQPSHVVCRVENPNASGNSNCAVAEAIVAPGQTKTVTVPFASPQPWNGDVKDSPRFESDNVVSVSVETDQNDPGQMINVRSITASVGPPVVLPTWLGKRPPVPGNWTKTLDENFDGGTINPNLWALPPKPQASIYDGTSVEVAQNAFVENGMLKIKFEKPDHLAFSDPSLNSRKYVSSEVTSFDKWSQKYGYIEARMKLPATLGMWPAFWLMPDRGKAAGDQWVRQDTKNGGMEFDIMEHLVRFGPYRYNIAMHWDGYQEQHKFIGKDTVYFKPDKDGFITTGLLWEPGEAIFYCNGKVVGTWKNDRISNVPAYIIFTMPCGGWGTNGYVDDSKLPDTFQIDYVRAWQSDAPLTR